MGIYFDLVHIYSLLKFLFSLEYLDFIRHSYPTYRIIKNLFSWGISNAIVLYLEL